MWDLWLWPYLSSSSRRASQSFDISGIWRDITGTTEYSAIAQILDYVSSDTKRGASGTSLVRLKDVRQAEGVLSGSSVVDDISATVRAAADLKNLLGELTGFSVVEKGSFKVTKESGGEKLTFWEGTRYVGYGLTRSSMLLSGSIRVSSEARDSRSRAESYASIPYIGVSGSGELSQVVHALRETVSGGSSRVDREALAGFFAKHAPGRYDLRAILEGRAEL